MKLWAFLPVLAPGAEYPVIPYIPQPELFGCCAVPFISKLFLAFSVAVVIVPFEYPYWLIDKYAAAPHSLLFIKWLLAELVNPYGFDVSSNANDKS